MTVEVRHRLVVLGTAFVGAAIAAGVPFAWLGPTAWNAFLRPWTLFSTAIFLTAWLTVRLSRTERVQWLWVAGSLGIAAAVLVHVAVDSLVYHRDHDLFPIEIAVMATLAVPAALAGTLAAAMIIAPWNAKGTRFTITPSW